MDERNAFYRPRVKRPRSKAMGNDLLGRGQRSLNGFLVIVVKNFAQHASSPQLMNHDSAKYMFIH